MASFRAAPLGFALAAAAVLVIPIRASAQTGSITGRVVNAEGQVLAGVSLTVTGTRLGAVTGSDGAFRIDAVPAGDHGVRASMIGYAAAVVQVTVTAGEGVGANITLESSALALPEVVAVGYATQRARDVSGAVTTVTAEQLNP